MRSRRRHRISTEDLGIRAYSRLIDRVSAFAATELGVTFPATYDQWEREQIDMDTGEITPEISRQRSWSAALNC